MNQFDFKQIGKRMPYNIPDGFFDQFEEDVMAKVQQDTHSLKNHNRTMWIVVRASLAIAAAIVLLFIIKPFLPKSNTDDFESVELAFNKLSPDDQEYLIQVYEEDDLFINP